MSEKLLVAVDIPGMSESVAAWLAARGRATDGELDVEIVTVADPGWIPAGAAEVDYRNGYEQALLAAEEMARIALPTTPVKGTLVWGAPVDHLVEASSQADLLVLGSERPGTFSGLIAGTVPLRVVARSECPVIVIPSGWVPVPGADVVVGVALAPSDNSILEFAVREAERARGSLRIVHAVPPPRALLASDLIGPAAQDELTESAERMLGFATGEVAARHPDLTISSDIPQQRAARSLIEEGKTAGLVVVGTHGRGLLRRMVVGSVSHELLVHAPCPVAVVRNTQAAQ